MADLVWADVTAIDAGLSSLAADSQAAILEVVELECPEAKWGKFHKRGRALLAAHLGTLSKRGGNGQGGPVSSESAGGVSRSYAAFSPMGSDPILDSTPWGKEYRRVRRLCGLAGGIVP